MDTMYIVCKCYVYYNRLVCSNLEAITVRFLCNCKLHTFMRIIFKVKIILKILYCIIYLKGRTVGLPCLKGGKSFVGKETINNV